MTQNWMGLTIDFNKVEDKTADSGFELLKEGDYRVTIKSLNKSELGSNHKQALTLNLSLDDFNEKEQVHNLFLPEQGDSETTIKFKNENLRNFFTRFAFRQLTKSEFKQLDKSVINAELQKIQAQQPKFEGAKMLVTIKQEPYISRYSDTKGIKWTDKPYNPNELPKSILKLIQAEEKKGIEFTKMPVIMFSNKVAAFGFGFYNDYNENAELKNSKVYDFVIEHGLNVVASAESAMADEVPSF